MSSAAVRSYLTPEQYLALERASEIRHEYHDGQMFAMSGATRPHNLVAGNLFREISTQLRDRPCEVYMADMRVWVDPTGLYTYPDIVAVCGEPRFQDREIDTLLNPTAIIEVLSPSTEAYDRGRKFAHYRRLESLREYVLVAQDRVSVERYTRQGEEWVLLALDRLEEVLRLESIGCAVALSAIYEKVSFPPEGQETDSNREGG